MAASSPNWRFLDRPAADRGRAAIWVLAGVLLLAPGSFAAGRETLATGPAAVAARPAALARPATRATGAVTLDAASSDVDYRSNTVVFRDIVITQGAVRVAAQQARATGLDFENSTWTFSGAVRITVDGGALRSDEATVNFAANRISTARIRGTPAEFEQPRAGTSDVARGRAGAIDYDVGAGTVTLIGDAWLTDGRNEIRGQQLTYDVLGQRVQSGSRPGQGDRVQITIRPRPAAPPPGAAAGDGTAIPGGTAPEGAARGAAPPAAGGAPPADGASSPAPAPAPARPGTR
ncbi:MAG: lipopolysaccharide transport periplasmic protein LptA [Steroidobacteraceae bacterium]|jgi:lipopolysaccharide transport protein LptA|nr:lipopolysaccharide transport periplasmic protein LptA [Steroidobacteraceae bacterium]